MRAASRDRAPGVWLALAVISLTPALHAVPRNKAASPHAAPRSNAASSSAVTRAAAERSTITPVAERQLARGRRTLATQGQDRARAERRARVNLQIPERLQRTLQAAIDARIDRNIVESKQLGAQARQLLRQFIAEAPADSPEMPVALLRLGELEWEQARDAYLAEFRRWERRPAESRGEPPLPRYVAARALFLRVLQQYKSFRDYDLALYVDGFLANEEGRYAEARGRFDRILEWFPKSRFVPDAHMVRAEYEFTRQAPDYAVALAEYEAVLRHRESELYDLALFKSAWTLWRLGRREQAAARFLAVFQNTELASERTSARRRAEIDELQNEALKNLVAVFVEDEQNTADDLHRFLREAGGEKFAGRIVRTLAETLYEQAHYERGIEAYRLLIRLEPLSPEAPDHALAVARGHSTLEAWHELVVDYRNLLRDYTAPTAPAPGSAWVRAAPKDVTARARAAIERQLREDAVGLHAKAQADKTSRAEFAAAAELYSVYLSGYPASPAAHEMFFNRGELRFYHLEQPAAAADDYLRSVELAPRGALSRDALYNALAALERARTLEFAAQAGSPARDTDTDRKLTRAMELYVKTYPTDPAVPELLFRQGKLYYDHGVFDAAVRQWGLLLEKYPRDRFAADAGELILDSFNKSQDYANIETWARRLKATPAFASPAQQSRLETLIVQAVFKQGEQLSEQRDHQRAARAYLRAASEFPREPRAAQAAVNATIEARRAGDLATLRAAADLLGSAQRARPEAAEGIWVAAEAHQAIGLLREAAVYHEQIVEWFPRSGKHRDAAFNAVLLRTSVGDHEAAIRDGTRFRKTYARDPAAEEVTFLMGKAHEKAGQLREAAQLYDRYARTAKRYASQIEALVRLARVQLRLEQGRAASAALERASDIHDRHKSQLDKSGRYFAAEARYMLGERLLAEFAGVTIEGDVKQLKARLRRKSELLKRAADAFLDTAELGVAEWTTAALYQIGFTYESFAKALLSSPAPSNLSPEDQELYTQSIEEFVIPIEERALEAYESGWQKAVELGIFNAWTARMRAALGRLNSELYPPLNEAGFALRTRVPEPLPELIDGPRRTPAGRSAPYLLEQPGQTKPAEVKR